MTRQVEPTDPDVLVEREDYRELLEMKRCATDPKFEAKTRLLKAELPSLGYSYRMLIAEDFARQPRLSNALQILKYGRLPVDDATREQFGRSCCPHLLSAGYQL